MFILLIGRVINVAMPYTLSELIKALEGKSEASLWPYLFGYVGLRFLQGTGGLSAVRDVSTSAVHHFCSPLTNYFPSAYGRLLCNTPTEVGYSLLLHIRLPKLLTWCAEMSQLSFDHLLNLSYAWHTKRKTGEILRVLDRGAAINHTLEVCAFIRGTFVVALIVI